MPDYQIVVSELANLSNFEQSQKVSFSEAQKTALSSNNFFIAANYDKFYSADANNEFANRNDDWTYLYKSIGGSYNVWQREPENSVFITTDFLTHVYHKLLEEEFSYIEEINFYPTLSSLSKSMLELSATAYSAEENAQQKESYERLSAYFLVTSAILENATEDYNSFKEQNFVNDSQSDKKQAVLAAAESLAKDNNVSDNTKNIAKREITLIFDAKTLRFKSGECDCPYDDYCKHMAAAGFKFIDKFQLFLDQTDFDDTDDSADVAKIFVAWLKGKPSSMRKPREIFPISR